MYVYNVKNLSETAMKAVMRNLLKDYSEEDARTMMIEKYPHLEGEIVNIDVNDNDDSYTVKTSEPASVSFENIDDSFDEDAELDVKNLTDTESEETEEDETDRLIKAVESAIEASEQPAKIVKKTTRTPATKAVKPVKAIKPAKVAKPAVEKGETKASRAREMYAKATDKSRKTIIALYMSELGLSAAAASTYYYSAKTKFGD